MTRGNFGYRKGFLPVLREGQVCGYRAESFPEDQVKHLFSARQGGVSEGVYASLNLSWRRSDLMERIRENYRIACEVLGVEMDRLVFSEQTHSNSVAYVTEKDVNACRMKDGLVNGVDALITDRKGIVLTARTADCVPILLYDPEHEAIGAVHSGWKGTVGNIAGETVRAMQERFFTNPEALIAAIGPSIGPCCFYVDEDVTDRFAEGGFGQWIVDNPANKASIDLWGCCVEQLMKAGVPAERISLSRQCTACDEEHFFSHRRDKGDTGGMCAFISLI